MFDLTVKVNDLDIVTFTEVTQAQLDSFINGKYNLQILNLLKLNFKVIKTFF